MDLQQGLMTVALVLVAAMLAVLVRWLWLRARDAEGAAERGTEFLEALADTTGKVAESPDKTTAYVLAMLAREGFEDPAVLVLDEPSDRWLRRTDVGEAQRTAEGAVADLAQRAWDTDAPVVAPTAGENGRDLVACPLPGSGGVGAVLVARGSLGASLQSRDLFVAAASAGLLGLGGPLLEDSPADRGRGDGRPSGPVDSLTGLGTPSSFGAALETRCREGGRPVALLLVSLEGVESVAQELGWRSGEEVLRIGARRLRRCLRPDDEVARIEASVFGVLLAEATEPDDAAAVAERALRALDGPVAVTGGEVQVRGSAALSWDGTGSPEPGRILADAKEALTRADGEVARAVRVGEATVAGTERQA